MEEYPIAMSQRTGSNRPYWIMVVASPYRTSSSAGLSKSKIFSEGEGPFIILLSWPTNFTWRIFVVFTVYISTIVTALMITKLSSIVILIVVQHVCSLFFAIDFFLALLHRITYLPAKIFVCRRKYKWLVIEAISLLPLSTIYIILDTNYDREFVFWLSSVVFLRLYRIPQFFSEEANAAGISHFRLTLLEYILYLFLSIFTFSILWETTDRKSRTSAIKDWNATEENSFYVAMYFSLMTFTNTGFGDISASSSYERLICSAQMLTGFALTSGMLVGALTTDLWRKEKPREKYRQGYGATIRTLKRYKVGKKKQQKLLADLNMLWKYKRGVSDNGTIKMFPIPLRKEICFDISFGLLNRSLIFSNQERSFLRSISLAMKNKTYLPGDDIIHPKGVFRGMLCLASGVIELLSRENDDTPIISFTSGTILGEVSLFMPMPIKTIIRAATFVELQVLDTIDFYRLALKYPNNYASMREDILLRFKASSRINLNTVVNTLDPEEDLNPRVRVLKTLIEELRREEIPEPEPSSSQDTFKINILNLYVFIENLPRVKILPINIMRNRTWILRPDTSLTNAWNKFMFITVTVVLFSYPYLAAFVREIDNTIFALMLLVQIIYMADLFLQCITAIPRNDLISYKTSIKEIILTRLKSYRFYLDVVSTYDFGVFSPLFEFGSESYIRLLLSQNKLLKAWVIPHFFKKIEDELSTNLLTVRMLKYIYYSTFLINFSSAIIYIEACPGSYCHPDRWFIHQQAKEVEEQSATPFTEHPYVLSLYMALMSTSTAGFGNIVPSCLTDAFTIMVLMMIGLMMFNYCLAELSVTFKHRERKKTEFQEEIFAIDRFLVEHNLPQDLRKRVKSYFEAQWYYDEGASFKRDIPLEQLPKKQREMMLSDRLQTLQAVPIFKSANLGFMVVLAKGSKVRILPKKEMVVYAGGLDKEMYILQSGYCKITDSRKSSEAWVIGPFTSFGDLEMIQGVPISMNVETLTHARIICIEYSTYLRAVTKYPDVRREIEWLMESQNPKKYLSFAVVPYEEIDDETTDAQKSWFQNVRKSFVDSLINVYEYDKSHGLNYWKPFQAWHKFRFFKYLCLPYVIKPNSVLIHVWMAVRIAASLIMGLIAPVCFGLHSVTPELKSLIIILQFVAWIDIYVTLHVAYYDRRGILTFHPAKTVVHYLKNGFALDFLLGFPFFWILDAAFKPRNPNLFYNGAGLLKVFQFYKFLQASSHYEEDILKRSAIIKLLKYLPTVLILTNLATGLLILIECHIADPSETIRDENSTMGIYRQNILRLCTQSKNSSNPEGDFDLYIMAYYWITASMTSCGFGDLVPHDYITMIICIFIVILGVFLYGFMFASIASSKIYAHHNVTKYRTKMREMMMFLEKENIDSRMQKRFFMHYLHNWNRTLGHMPQKTLSHIHTSLKQDIVDRIYEKPLRKVSIFSFMDKSFMRSIGKYIDEIYFLKGETIVKRSHIQKDLYIIYRGKVDIFGPDGKLVISMKNGGIFGNIAEKSYALSSITAIAATKVELLRLKNEDFHKTLLSYPSVKERIMTLTVENQDYIIPFRQEAFLSLEDFDSEPDEDFGSNIEYLTDSMSGRSEIPSTEVGRFYLRRAVYKESKSSVLDFIVLSDSWLHSLMALVTIFLSYVSFILTSYVFAFQNFHVGILVPYILVDLFFYLKFFMEFHYTYFDSRGVHIYEKKAIRKRYVSSKRFYIDLIANFPLDLLAFAAPGDLQLTTLSFLRLNRLLRLYYIMEYYKRKSNTLLINIIMLEIGPEFSQSSPVLYRLRNYNNMLKNAKILFHKSYTVFMLLHKLLLCGTGRTLIAWLSSIMHLFACIWYMAACPIFYCNERSWLTALEMQNVGEFDIYVTSLYFVITLMTTTGYGDIVAISRQEIIIATLMMITSHFSMVLGAVTFLAMVSVHTLNFLNYEEKIAQLRRDLRRQKISKYQLKNLWSYVKLLWWRENGKQIPQFISSAPYIMKCDVFSAMYGQHLSYSYIFSDLDDTFLRQLTIYMVRYVFFPGNYIVQQGDNDGTMYFIHRGEVSVMTIHLDLMETIHYSVRDNDQFGISQGLIFGLPHQFSYRAETEVEILSLTLGDWQHLFKYFPHVKSVIYERLERLS